MQSQISKSTSELKIKGSSGIISDYFEICIHNILFQRHIYPAQDFKVVRKFGLNLVYSNNDEVIKYIQQIVKQLHRWIYLGEINWFTMLILNKGTNEITEKWLFHINLIDDNSKSASSNFDKDNFKSLTVIQSEIQSIIKQISSSVTFLPDFEELQTFKILVNTISEDIKVPKNWNDMDLMKDLVGSTVESVKFDSFCTNKHQISSFVTYKPKEQ